MVEKGELRIGNKILNPHQNKGYTVIGIKPGSAGIGYYILTLEDDSIYISSEIFSGIPLTEEWLLRFGFENHDSELPDKWQDKYRNVKDYSIGEFFVELYNCGVGNNPDKVVFEYDGSFNTNEIEIKYVHQLQNLYFALTGEELTIPS